MTDPLYVSRLRLNWKQQAAPAGVTHNLNPLMYVTGPPGAGKTAIVEGLSLALTGTVPAGYLGRKEPTSSPNLLWRSKPKEASTLWSEATLSDGRVIRWEQKRHNSRPTRTIDGQKITPNNPLPVVVLTVDEVRANIVGRLPKTAEKWLAGRLHIGVPEVMAKLKEGYKTKDGLIKPSEATVAALTALCESPTITTPALLLEKTIKLANEARNQADAAGQVEEALEHAVELVTDEELATATQKVAEAEAAHREALAGARAVNELQGLATNLTEATTQLRALPEVPPRATLQLHSAQATLTALQTTAAAYPGNHLCPTCREAVGVEALERRRESLVEFIARAAPSVQALSQRETLLARIERLRSHASRLREQLGDAVFAAVRQGVWEDESAAAGVAASVARADLNELQIKRVGAAGPTLAAEQRAKVETRRETLRAAAQHVEKAQSALVDKALSEFVTGARKLYPTNSFGKPVITMRPNIVLGVERDGRPGAPSGCQEEALLLSLAGSLAQMETKVLNGAAGGPDSPLSLLVFGDVGMDSETTHDLLTLFTAWTGGQLLVPTTAEVPQGEVPEEWGQIRLTAATP